MVRESSERIGARRVGTLDEVGVEALTDEQLLDRFLAQTGDGADAAFRTLVLRHGPMVLGVCRNVLRETHDAEDAFQATFLVLARKGRTIRDRRVVGRWLYEVAYRIAVRARSHAVRRRVQERQAAKMPSTSGEYDRDLNDLMPLIHEEINRLPANYRTPIALCYLEGKTHEEAAALLEWPLGTVKGRLSRARELLRSRLSRRGVTLSAAFIGVFLSEKRLVAADLPAALVDATVRNMMRLAACEADALNGPTANSSTNAGTNKLSRPVYRILLAVVIVLGTGYGFTNYTAYASSLPPEARPRIANFFLDLFAYSPSGNQASCH